MRDSKSKLEREFDSKVMCLFFALPVIERFWRIYVGVYDLPKFFAFSLFFLFFLFCVCELNLSPSRR